ncbi:MAG TPA: type II secretion system protein GspM [Ramlibacter sp.]|nr:type II secretion system protein GspM [Ramlibacter sp.]
MKAGSLLKARWDGLAPREKAWVAAAIALVAAMIVWFVAVGPALATLRTAEAQHRALDAQLQQMRGLQQQAQALQSQPKQSHEEALRQLELSVRERLGPTARSQVTGERVTITLAGTAPSALAQWLTQVRVNARALPSEARLSRNPGGLWEGTVVLTLPPR